MVLLWMADEISAHFIDCGMVSYSVSLWAVPGTKVLCKVGINRIYVLWRWQFVASSVYLSSAVTSFLSPQVSQLPFFHVHGYFSTVK